MAVSVSPRMGFPVIERVLPLAVTCGGNLAVRLSNIDLSIPLTVLCRAGDRQHILDINHQKQISAEHGILELGVM